MTSALTLSGISHDFNGGLSLSDINLSMEPGECLALIGPSGAGKSTLLTLLDGRLKGWSGTASVLNNPLDANHHPHRNSRADTGFIFQDFALVDRLSTYQNVMNGRLGRTKNWASVLGHFSTQDHMIVGSILRDTNLVEFADRRVDQLSGGQRQRVAIARCLAQEPKLILADEPVSNLDPALAEKVLQLLTGEARKRGIGVIFTSHQPELSQRFADRIVGLRDGRIQFDQPTHEVSESIIKKLYFGCATEPGLRVVK
ncbi:phosphonate ABC transporter ATP-binding protein [Kiloniella sp.]|uniref:phosphonate ABC transporter ATP-binding protein n=1 Tax=Kiloniella sp. TaxID=1938587 RepID=UPI003B02EAB3